jgi:general secretion pathway protein A
VKPPPPDLLTVLHRAAGTTDLDGAYARLFSLWGARYATDSGDACIQAQRQNLECLSESGGEAVLRRYNRPAILELEDETGVAHQTVVTRLGTGSAWLMIGDTENEVPLTDLAQRWNGEFQLLWKPQQLDSRSLLLGMSGEPVRVLRERLQQWAGIAPEAVTSDLFDEPLRQLVLQFQRGNGLNPDGVAGARTQALLDTRFAATGTPLLSAALH